MFWGIIRKESRQWCLAPVSCLVDYFGNCYNGDERYGGA